MGTKPNMQHSAWSLYIVGKQSSPVLGWIERDGRLGIGVGMKKHASEPPWLQRRGAGSRNDLLLVGLKTSPVMILWMFPFCSCFFVLIHMHKYIVQYNMQGCFFFSCIGVAGGIR